MNCPTCHASLPDDASFCGHCGSAVSAEITCGHCSRTNPADMRFCLGCGRPRTETANGPRADPRAYTPHHLADKILTSRAALEGERKQVTVLFADVKGSMELAEQVDPEEWHKILDRFFQILTDSVHRFEGTVNQYTGDGIMALFGAPIAHEDHAQRACYAALHLTDELRRYADQLRMAHGLNFSVRMGLNSGEVVVGKIGDDLRMDYTAQGHTVGLAARMEQLAEPGKVFLSEHTATLVGGYFTLRDLGRTQVKGVLEPLGVFALEGAGRLRTRFDVSRARGLTRFVGRDNDLAALDAALESARQGNGQVVGVVGEAGLGKSRLCFEFLERCRAQGLQVFEGHAVAHGKNIAFLPMLQVFRAYYGITEQDSDRMARDKIAGRMLLLDESFREVLPVLFEFFAVPDPDRPPLRLDPEVRQRQLFAVLRRLVRPEIQTEPALTLIEDLHWIDGGSAAFLEQWVEAIGGARGVLLLNFRPEYHAGWMQKSYYRQIPLTPLGPEAVRSLLEDLLGHDASLRGLTDAIHARTAGNPFFTEEVVQSLITDGHLEGSKGAYRLATPVATIEVPSTVQAVLAARIDRLPEREKQVLQTAAVIGKEFSEPVLRRVLVPPFGKGGPGGICGASELDVRTQIPLNPPLLKGEEYLAAALHALSAAEFVYEQALYPVAEYAFKHPLTQEVAYQSQLRERRGRAHAAAARAITELHADKLDERAALLAYHWENAGEWWEAARWHHRAAAWAGVANAAEALRHWEQVRSLVQRLPQSSEVATLGATACLWVLSFGWRLGATDEEAARTFEEGCRLARESGDLQVLAALTGTYGGVRGMVAGSAADYVRYAEEATQLADQTGNQGLQLAMRAPLAFARYFAGDFPEGLAVCDAAREKFPPDFSLGREFSGYSPYIALAYARGMFLQYLGRLQEAQQDLERAEQLARVHNDSEILAWIQSQRIDVAARRGDTAAALERARLAVELAEKSAVAFGRVIALYTLGLAHGLVAQWSEAIAALEEALRLSRDSRAFRVGEGEILAMLAEALLGQGDWALARRSAAEGIAVARSCGNKGAEVEAQLALAHAVLRSGEATALAEAEDALAAAQALVDATGARLFQPDIHEARAELARLRGDDGARERELREAQRLFSEMGATGHAERISRQLSAVSIQPEEP
jgi:class 3 adenylate cyclase/tetratricopeptide (TPR) repeat protein